MSDAIAVILSALQSGGVFVGGKFAEEAVKDSYSFLKGLLTSRLHNEEEKQAIIPRPGEALDAWQVRAVEILERIDAANDPALLSAAHKLLSQVSQTQNSAGKFNLQANSVGTVVQGDHSHVTLFRTDPRNSQE